MEVEQPRVAGAARLGPAPLALVAVRSRLETFTARRSVSRKTLAASFPSDTRCTPALVRAGTQGASGNEAHDAVWCVRHSRDVASLALPGRSAEAQGQCYQETGFCIENPQFQEYFRVRGGTRILGYPVSRAFMAGLHV
jgi:hypothetical protein